MSLSKGPKSDFSVLIVTFVLTVIFDLTIAIEIGLLLAVVLFIRRTTESSVIRVFHNELDPNDSTDYALHEDKLIIPEGVSVYEIDGPYFFGVANKFDEIMQDLTDLPKVRVIRMRKVPFIDSTGLHNLETLCLNSKKAGIKIILSGVNDRVRATLIKARLQNIIGEENICSNINEALAKSAEYVK